MPCVVENLSDEKNDADLRVRIPVRLKNEIDSWCARKRIKQQAAVEALVSWIIKQDDFVQTVILGNIALDDELLAVFARRIIESSSGGPKLTISPACNPADEPLESSARHDRQRRKPTDRKP